MSKKKNKKNLAKNAPEQIEVKEAAELEEVAEEVVKETVEEVEALAEEKSEVYAPAAEEYLDKQTPQHDKPKAKGASPARIIISLTIICALIAALLGAVNGATKGKIAENTELEKAKAIQKIFGSYVTIEEYTDFPESATMEAYLIFRSDMLYGYCANVSPSGFGGAINMMVGVDYSGAVCGVNIVSMSETPGLGSKANTPDFLAQFNGKKGNLSTVNGIDAISGATITSNAVCAGVNTALSAGIDLAVIAEERGVLLYVEDLDTTPPETEMSSDGVVIPVVTSRESSRVEDGVEYVDGIENPNGAPGHERPGEDIPVIDETMVYETETTAPDTETETDEEPEDTTHPAETTTKKPEETTTKKEETTTEKEETTTKKPEESTTETTETTTEVPESSETEVTTGPDDTESETELPDETTTGSEETTEKPAESAGVADESTGEEASA